MEEIRKQGIFRTESLEDEVVGYYEPGACSEVVGVLAHAVPLPGKAEVVPVGKKKRKKILWICLACFCVAAVTAGAVFFGVNRQAGDSTAPSGDGGGATLPGDSFGGFDYIIPSEEEKFTGVQILPVAAGDTRLSIARTHGKTLTPQEIYAQVNPAVVTVMVDLVSGTGSVGTGVIFTTDGYLLTNYHVIEGGLNCAVALSDNAKYNARYVAGDRANDIAILKIEGQDFPAAELGDSSALQVGDVVYAIGSPLGTELRGTLTNGLVSAVNRDVDVDGRTMILLQTNTALNSGNSGGPLINQYGQVVGINTIKMMSDYSTVEGLGFAIPSQRIEQLGNQLLTKGYVAPEPLLGITVEQLGTKLPDGTVGARIAGVTAGSAADVAGLKAEDILVEAGGEPVHGSGDVLRVRNRFSVGDRMTVRVWRGDAYVEAELLLLQTAE